MVLGVLHPHFEPALDLQVINMHVLSTDEPAVSIGKTRKNLEQCELLGTVDRHGGKSMCEVFLRESVEFRIEFWRLWTLPPEGIDHGYHVATHPISAHKLVDLVLQLGMVIRKGRPF